MRDASFIFLVSDTQKVLAGLKVLEASLHGLLPCKRDKGNNWSLHFLYFTFDKFEELMFGIQTPVTNNIFIDIENTIASLKNQNRIGGFSDNSYWSSTEVNTNAAWLQNFFDGSQRNDELKYDLFYVRAIRAF